jgi:cobalt-zinc-cadmium resistance protein CzcA
MIQKIIQYSIHNKLVIGICIVAFIGLGIFQVTQLPIDAVPDITDNQVQVITYSPSLSAIDIERLVTSPLEQANSNIPGLKEIRSFSRFGLSVITIVFNDNIDVYWARQQVSERLQTVRSQIPPEVGDPELAPVTTGLGEIYQYVLRPKPGYEHRYDAMQLRTLQDWIVRRQLIQVKGVADVSSFGGLVKQYEIAINPDVLHANQLTLRDVFDAIQANNDNTGGAYLERHSTVLYIRTEGLYSSAEEIGNTLVKQVHGVPVFVRDVARVQLGKATRYGSLTLNDQGEVAGGVVMMLKGENSSRVIEKVKSRIEQIQATLPAGVLIEPFLDRTKMVDAAIGTVTTNLLEGALIVIFILVLFLGNLRAGLLVASIIPLSLLFAITMMNIFGVSGNLMSLGALDFGLIVDGAVIIVEAIMHEVYRQKGNIASPAAMNDMVLKTSLRMRNAALFGELIILVVYLPIFTLQGIEGKMFLPMAQTVAFSLLGAFLLSITYVPMMSAWLLRKQNVPANHFSNRMIFFFEKIHGTMLLRVLRFPKTVIASTSIIFLFALFIFSRLGGEFIPELPEGDFAVETRVLPGSNLSVTVDAVTRAAAILKRKFPEVIKVVSKIGSGEIPTDPMPMEAADMMVILKDKKEWVSASSWSELSANMYKALEDIPGVFFSFQYPVAMRFNELMTGAKQDVVCKIYGENLDTLAHYADQLGHLANKVEGAEDVFVEPIEGLPQLVIPFDRNKMAQFGLTIRDVNRVIHTALAGEKAGLVFEDEKRFDLVVRLDTTYRNRAEDIENLLIPLPSGEQIPLHQIADVQLQPQVSQIQRDNAQRRVMVAFNAGNRDVQHIVEDVKKQVESKLKLPAGYYVTYGGAFENLQAANQRLLLAVPVALLLIFILLYFAFRSIPQGLMIYSAIPLSATGGILFLALRGMPFSISAGVGFIALFGVAVLNGIVLLSEYNRLRSSGMTNLKDIVLEGTRIRIRPVLMTALVASLGFLPMAISQGAGAEVQRPLATVVIGGLLVATLLTLFILPVLYVLIEGGRFKKISGTKVSAMVTVGIILFCSLQANAQKKVTWKEACTLAEQHYQPLRQTTLETQIAVTRIGTAFDLPNTMLSAESGQINSSLIDIKVGIAQSLKFPTVYKHQENVLRKRAELPALQGEKKMAEVRKDIALLFNEYLYSVEQQRLLLRMDSLFLALLQKANLRLQQGETDRIETLTAENQRGQIQLQLRVVDRNQQRSLENLFFLVGEHIIPEGNFFEFRNPSLPNLVNHPEMTMMQQQQAIQQAELDSEKKKLLPDIQGGLYWQSFRSVSPATNTYMGLYGTVGLGIPLFRKSLQQKIKTMEFESQWQENQRNFALTQYEHHVAVLQEDYKALEQSIQQYESVLLPNTRRMLDVANQKLKAGDIHFLDWVKLAYQYTETESSYLQSVQLLQQNIAQLQYYDFQTSKK